MVWSVPDDRPLIEELAAENQGTVKVGKVNIDDSPNIAATYGVSSIPTLMIFKGGDVVDRLWASSQRSGFKMPSIRQKQ